MVKNSSIRTVAAQLDCFQDAVCLPVGHKINNFLVSANWVRIPVFPFQLTPGFVILCGANIVGNIISAENRSNLLSRAKPGNPASNIYVRVTTQCINK